MMSNSATLPKLLALVLLILINCPMQTAAAASNETTNSLITTLLSIRPWSDRRAYDQADWTHLIEVAKHCQTLSTPTLANALKLYAECALSADVREEQKLTDDESLRFTSLKSHPLTSPYLLMRVMFDLPNNLDPPARNSWLATDNNWGVQTDMSWPIRWRNDTPELVSDFLGSIGNTYDPEQEYLYFRTHFPLRDLKKIKMETLAHRISRVSGDPTY